MNLSNCFVILAFFQSCHGVIEIPLKRIEPDEYIETSFFHLNIEYIRAKYGVIPEKPTNFKDISDLKIKNLTYEEAIKQPSITFSVTKFDGIPGLAYPTISVFGVLPLFDNIVTRKPLEKNIFPFCLSVNVGNQLKLCEGGYQTVFDTGTSGIVGLDEEVKALHKLIAALPLFNGEYIIRCSKIPPSPVIIFQLEGRVYNLTGDQYILKESVWCEYLSQWISRHGSSATCWPTVVPQSCFCWTGLQHL